MEGGIATITINMPADAGATLTIYGEKTAVSGTLTSMN
jgi:hypothetical protein